MKIIAIRHLPTKANNKGLLQGTRNVEIAPPTPQYLSEIEANRQCLNALGKIDRILVSQLKRTQQTAQLYGLQNITVEPLLNELNFGKFEGGPKSALEEELGQAWFADPRPLILGESVAHFQTRIERFLQKYQTCKQILLFGHGAWIRGLLSLIDHGDLRAMNARNLPNNHLIQVEITPQPHYDAHSN